MISSRLQVISISLAIVLVLAIKILVAAELCEKPDLRIDQRRVTGAPTRKYVTESSITPIEEIRFGSVNRLRKSSNSPCSCCSKDERR